MSKHLVFHPSCMSPVLRLNGVSDLSRSFSTGHSFISFRRNPCRTDLRPHKRLEIIEERLHGGKDRYGMVGKIGAEHLLIAERMVDHELLMPDQFEGRRLHILAVRS